MNKKLIKNLLSLSFILLLLIPQTVYGHTDANTGSESVGWKIDADGHAGTDLDSYSINAFVTDRTRQDIINGAARWESSPVSFYQVSSGGTGHVSQYSDIDSDIPAYYLEGSTNSLGHLLSWSIHVNGPVFNSVSEETRLTIIAHEFGHAVGLYDLYYSYNDDKLLYGEIRDDGSHIGYPSYEDELGASEANH
jgi:hypothetical protein